MCYKLLVLFTTFSILVGVSRCIVCTPEFCAGVQCAKIGECEGPNKVIKPGGFCQCCDLCHTILGENDTCSNVVDALRGVPPPLAECGNGLICHEGKCRSFKALTKTAVLA